MSRTTRSTRMTRRLPAERPMTEYVAPVEVTLSPEEEARLIAEFPIEDYPGCTRSHLFVSGGRVFINANVDLAERAWNPAPSIRKPQVARMPWDVEGEPFDPARVSKTLSPAYGG